MVQLSIFGQHQAALAVTYLSVKCGKTFVMIFEQSEK